MALTTLLIIMSALPVYGNTLPVYLNWHSSNSYKYYSLLSEYSIHIKDDYNVHFGIDTLYKDIHAQIDLANQEEGLFSQVIIDHAILDYQTERYGLKLSMEDFGYGKDFLLYNRRNDDALFGKSRLFSYRWHGIDTMVRYKNHHIGLGLGNNYVNYTVSEAYYGYQSELLNLKAFAVYTPNDNQFNIPVYHFGTELIAKKGILSLHSAYAYTTYPEHKFFPEMDNYQLLNELSLMLTPQVRLILSSDYKTIPENNEEEYLNELALALNYKKLHNYIGINQKTILTEKAITYFADVNFHVIHNLSVGLFYDYTDFSEIDSYSKIGIQSSYSWN